MIFKTFLAAVAATAIGAMSASAATYVLTEGKRATVTGDPGDIIGTTSPVDASGSPLGFDVNAEFGVAGFGGGDVLEIHGRIVGHTDHYFITLLSDAIVEWNFDGYNTAAGPVTQSGFIAVPSTGTNTSVVIEALASNCTPGVSCTSATEMGAYTTPLDGSGGEPSLIFELVAGTYVLEFRNERLGCETESDCGDTIEKDPALYDLRITTVPLPASALLLLGGLGGLATFGARKRAAKRI